MIETKYLIQHFGTKRVVQWKSLISKAGLFQSYQTKIFTINKVTSGKKKVGKPYKAQNRVTTS